MRDSESGEPIEVSTDGTGGPYITVVNDQLEEVRQLLRDNKITHSVDADAIQLDGVGAASVINLGNGADVEAIQRILDEHEPADDDEDDDDEQDDDDE